MSSRKRTVNAHPVVLERVRLHVESIRGPGSTVHGLAHGMRQFLKENTWLLATGKLPSSATLELFIKARRQGWFTDQHVRRGASPSPYMRYRNDLA